MKLFATVLLFLSTLVTQTPARADNACLEGDALMGPNCIHEEHRAGRDSFVTVYRVEEGHARTVWDGVGTILKSTKDFLLVEELVSDDDGHVSETAVRHNWTGTVYER